MSVSHSERSIPFDPIDHSQQLGGSLASARHVVPLILEIVSVNSVIDFGCGNGAWLSVARAHGVERIVGIEGGVVTEDALHVPEDIVHRMDLEEPIDLGESFDLAMSLEVGEHLPVRAARTLVTSIVAHADLVLFSAAIPLQGGLHHINEQWPEYWAELFGEHGYQCFDVLRWRIWSDERIEWWYRQNILLFAAGEAAFELVKGAHEPSVPHSLVHPVAMDRAAQQLAYQKGVRESARELRSAARRAVRRRLRNPDHVVHG
jgi:hypothetical protein